MEGPRPPLETELASVVKFLNTELRPSDGWSITSEYPVAFSEANRGNIRIITDSEQVLAHAVLRPMIVSAPSGLFKVGAIGSVVTSSEHRNQGLSSQTIASCLTAARARGCDFAILWTNLYDFYRKFGFELAGSEISLLIDSELKVPSDGLKFVEGPKVAAEAIHRLYSQHTVTSLRNIEETRKYLQIPNSRIYTAWDATNNLLAYAVEGKGADLKGYVHEWGGSVSALLPLFAHVREKHGAPITIISPRHSQNLIRTLEQHGVRANSGYLGMIKILNPTHLFAKLKRYARNIGVADLVLENQSGKFFIGTKDELFVTDSEQDLVRLIFGPQRASEIHDFGQEAAVLESVFPLDMWVWGWDSI